MKLLHFFLKLFVGIAAACLLLVILLVIMWTSVGWHAKAEESALKTLRIRGIAVGKGPDEKSCRGWILYEQGSNTDTLRDIDYCVSPDRDVWHYLGPGDSILKDAGTLEVFVKRKDTVKRFVFPTRLLR